MYTAGGAAGAVLAARLWRNKAAEGRGPDNTDGSNDPFGDLDDGTPDADSGGVPPGGN